MVNSFTVQTSYGTLARVAGADADSLGFEAPGGDEYRVREDAAGDLEVQPPGSESVGGHIPDVDKVLDRPRSLYDSEIPGVSDAEMELVFEHP